MKVTLLRIVGQTRMMYHRHVVSSVGRKIWDWFKEAGNLISLSFLAFVLIFFFRFAVTGSLFGGSIDSARYLLSALAQTQGAIVAIVISLTIVAVQVSSQAYSLRITGLLLKYEFFWLLLFLYGVSIVYDVILLNRINDGNIRMLGAEVNASILMAGIIFWALFPYAKKTMERLRPQTIIQILGRRILASGRGVFDANRREGILPLFDITKKAIRVDDIATARDGIYKLEEVCTKILAEPLNERAEEETAEYFFEQYQRTAKIAFMQNDIDSVSEISRSLQKIANNITEKRLSVERSLCVVTVGEKLADMGSLATEKRWEDMLGFVATSLSDLCVNCAEWQTPDAYLKDKSLQGVCRLSTDIVKDAALEILLMLSALNLALMRTDILLAARNTKRPLISACTRLIDKKLPAPFYEKMCSEILPLIRIQGILGVDFNWLPEIADVLAALGTESAEVMGNGFPASSFKQYLVYAIGTKPAEQLKITTPTIGSPPEEIIRAAIATIFNYINGVNSDAGAIWLVDAIEGIGNEYNKTGFPSLTQKAVDELGFIGSSLHFEGKQFTAKLSQRALESIGNVLRLSQDENLREAAFKASLRIVVETDDEQTQNKALALFSEASRSIEKPAFKVAVDRCLNEFKAENRVDLESSSERRTKLDQFIGDLLSIL